MNSYEIPLSNLKAVSCLAISPSSDLLAIGKYGDQEGNPNLVLWNLQKQCLDTVVEAVPEDHVQDIAFSTIGTLYYYINYHQLVCINPATNEKREKDWDTGHINQITVSPCGNYLLTSGEKTVVWDLDANIAIWQLENYTGTGISIVPSLKSQCWDSLVQLENTPYEKTPAWGIFYGSHDYVVIAGNSREEIQIFEIPSFQLVHTVPCAPMQVAYMTLGASRYLGIVGGLPRGVFIWDLERQERLVQNLFNENYVGAIVMCFYEKLKVIIIGTSIGFLNLHDLQSGNLLNSFQLHSGAVRDIVIDQQRQAVITGGDDGKVLVTEFNSLLGKR
jgi:WD40 repeat protein